MTALELRFPAGRMHATPWGRHVNEGAVEWPPSPWRILRALIATWYLKARDDVTESDLRALVQQLIEPPSYCLPPAAASHTRHYMPVLKGKNSSQVKIFDTFVELGNSPVVAVWDADLSPDHRKAFQLLAERLGYFGRAESLVEARVTDGVDAQANSHPLSQSDQVPAGDELVRVLCPEESTEYAHWRNDFASKQVGEGKKTRKSGDELPADLFDALHADTGKLQAAGWNLPPGSRYVNYLRPRTAFAPVPYPGSRRTVVRYQAARYEIVSAAQPRMPQVVSVADRIHAALCKWSDDGRGPSPTFTGCDEQGQPAEGHQHARLFCEPGVANDAVTYVTVYSPGGFEERDCRALRRLNKVWGHGGHDVRLVLHGIGDPADFPECRLFGPAKTWRSLTPFVATRHVKAHRDGRPKIDADNGWQIGSPGHDLLRLLCAHPNGGNATIRLLDERERPFRFGNRHLRSLQFQMNRRGNGRRGNTGGAAFEIEFPEPRNGPFALGYGAHFGLGLFVPVDPSNPRRYEKRDRTMGQNDLLN